MSNGSCSVSAEQLGDGRLCVTVVGEVDLYTAPQLKHALERPATAVIVDLADCEFIDSTGLGVLVAAHKRAGRFELVAPTLAVRRTLEVSGLDRILTVLPSRA